MRCHGKNSHDRGGERELSKKKSSVLLTVASMFLRRVQRLLRTRCSSVTGSLSWKSSNDVTMNELSAPLLLSLLSGMMVGQLANLSAIMQAEEAYRQQRTKLVDPFLAAKRFF